MIKNPQSSIAAGPVRADSHSYFTRLFAGRCERVSLIRNESHNEACRTICSSLAAVNRLSMSQCRQNTGVQLYISTKHSKWWAEPTRRGRIDSTCCLCHKLQLFLVLSSCTSAARWNSLPFNSLPLVFIQAFIPKKNRNHVFFNTVAPHLDWLYPLLQLRSQCLSPNGSNNRDKWAGWKSDFCWEQMLVRIHGPLGEPLNGAAYGPLVGWFNWSFTRCHQRD